MSNSNSNAESARLEAKSKIAIEQAEQLAKN